MTPPVIFARCCKIILGCQSCVDSWYRGEDVQERKHSIPGKLCPLVKKLKPNYAPLILQIGQIMLAQFFSKNLPYALDYASIIIACLIMTKCDHPRLVVCINPSKKGEGRDNPT